ALTPADPDTHIRPVASVSDAATTAPHGPQPRDRALLIAGGVLLLPVVLMAAFVPAPTSFQWLVFGTLAALGAAGIASSLPGLVELEVRGLRATGGFAVFVAVMWLFNREASKVEEATRTHTATAVTLPQQPTESETVQLNDGEVVDLEAVQ
ncbi:MAG: hypothetical protein ACPGUV_14265, partial [Polyangiales bacterium]